MAASCVRPLITAAAVLILPYVLSAQPAPITSEPLSENTFMLRGPGGNVGLCTGEDGILLVDGLVPAAVPELQAAIAKISNRPVRLVVNTHWHDDHTGANEAFGKAGALIVAHETVRQRMSVEQIFEAFNRRFPPAPLLARPRITFTGSVTFHWNGDEIRVFHLGPAHTDGDAFVHFKEAKVLHLGDLYSNGMYPFMESQGGAGINAMIAVLDQVLERIEPGIRIIPGHGPLSGVQELREYRNMLATVRHRLQKLQAEGKSLEEARAARPLQDLDARWGQGYMNADRFVEIVWQSLAGG